MRILKLVFFVMAIVLGLQACGTAGAPATETLPTATLVSETPTSTPYPALEFVPIPLKAGLGYRAAWIELYFTDPTSSFAEENSGGIEGPLTAAIVEARESVDVAVNSLGVNSIVQALIRVHTRGVRVRVVMETDNVLDRLNPQQLIDAGIPIVDDRREGLMNNTFLIVDNKKVLTGSINFTSSDMFKANNNLVQITSEEVAADYTKEFEEMFANDQFGPSVAPETPYPQVMIDGTPVEVLFSPDDVVISRLSRLIAEAQNSISFLTNSFTSDDLGKALRDRAAQGVSVTGVIGSVPQNQDNTSEYELFKQAGIDVRLARSSRTMNHKMILIDNQIVVIGSYDFTNRAENVNDENVVIIHNEKIAEKFMEEFQRVQSRAQ
jgi:phosphatidylserine/phosphatidylglycerophosphate/cardiolipin synthase-like enzyme